MIIFEPLQFITNINS